MRKLRPRLLLTLTSIAALAFWVACSDDDNDGTVVNPGIDSGNVDTDLPDVTTTQPDVVTTPPSGPDRDGGTLVNLDAGPSVDGGIPCYAGGELEEEPNDLLTQANEFPDGAISANVLKRILCGITTNDGGLPDAGDFESLRFTLGDASTDFFVRYEGNVTVTIETDGSAPVDISQPGVVLPRQYNQPYFIRVNAKDGKTQKWKIVLFEDQADAGR